MLINGVDKSGKITASSDSSITIKGKAKKLWESLTRDTPAQVISADGSASTSSSLRSRVVQERFFLGTRT